MARLSFGFMVLLLACSKITTANVLPAHGELPEKLNLNGENKSTYTGTSPSIEKSNILQQVEQNENLNKYAKRSIDYSKDNQLNNNYYDLPFPQSAPAVAPHPYSFFSLWQPQPYQIDRPYYIPVLRGPGGSSIILPPQPLTVNFGHPPDNPPKGYIPPNNGYLPPDNQQPQPCLNNTNIPIADRNNEPPVWGTVNGNPVPTRRPGLQPTTPPTLIHNPNDVDANVTPVTTTTTAASRPTPPPARLPPSSCVWSIVSCCSSTSAEINYRCFEQLGCEGAFWDGSPCDAPLARAAIASIMKYYQQE